jgi:hypothetical protein
MKKLTILTLVLLFMAPLSAQQAFQQSTSIDQLSVGMGGGLDYGGFGGKLIFYPKQSIGLFGGVGYALAGVGFSGGVKFRYIPDKADARIRPYGLVMYGYNAAIAVLNASYLNKLYYGPTLGGGIDFHRKPMKRAYWSFSLFVPIRKDEVKVYMDQLENEHGVDFQNTLFPVAISIAYNFIIK